MTSLPLRPIVAEALGTALLLSVVVGSGIMGERLSGGNEGLALLANSLATGAGLFVLILVFGPVSGAHFNPVVTLVFALGGSIRPVLALGYAGAQTVGAAAGVVLAHAIFAEPLLQVSQTVREGGALVLSEAVATFGLVATILACMKRRPAAIPEAVPAAVGLYILAAYWFTASTSFANPAVTAARALSDTFAGVAPVSVPAFIGAQIAGALAAFAVFNWLFSGEAEA